MKVAIGDTIWWNPASVKIRYRVTSCKGNKVTGCIMIVNAKGLKVTDSYIYVGNWELGEGGLTVESQIVGKIPWL